MLGGWISTRSLTFPRMITDVGDESEVMIQGEVMMRWLVGVHKEQDLFWDDGIIMVGK